MPILLIKCEHIYKKIYNICMYFELSKNDNSPLVCNVPHSSIVIPDEFKKDFAISEEELTNESQYMADNYTESLYSELLFISNFIKSNISRIVLDIERFKNENEEEMSKVGMSALYTKTSSGKLLRVISDSNKNKLEKIYEDYHSSFTDLVSASLSKNNVAIIVDCHSFPSVPRSYEPEQEIPRPDICIGADEFHTPKELVAILKDSFEKLGYNTKINTPFAGSIVPTTYYKKDKRVTSVMIEVNRKLYMNEETFQKLKTFSKVGQSISRCVISSLNQYYEHDKSIGKYPRLTASFQFKISPKNAG